MTTTSAGLLVWRRRGDDVQVLLGHPGGPFYARKDAGVWTIPKGEYAADEDALAAARREYVEELGLPVPPGVAVPLGSVTLRSRKVVTAWSLAADPDLTGFSPGTFELAWPPRSGRVQAFPEVDRIAWFSLGDARIALHPSQLPLLDRLVA